MDVSREQHGMVTVLGLRGGLNHDSVDTLMGEIATCKASGSYRIVLEIRDVPLIDSSGLEAIQTLVIDLGRRGGDLCLAGVNKVCQDIFTATRMESLVRIYDDVPSAVRSFT